MMTSFIRLAPLGAIRTQGDVIMSKLRSGFLRAIVVGSICTLFASSASADFKPTAAQRADCTGDAMSLCAYALASMDRVVACLAAKKSRLSPACRAHFEKH
jgi:hypothetical protein